MTKIELYKEKIFEDIISVHISCSNVMFSSSHNDSYGQPVFQDEKAAHNYDLQNPGNTGRYI